MRSAALASHAKSRVVPRITWRSLMACPPLGRTRFKAVALVQGTQQARGHSVLPDAPRICTRYGGERRPRGRGPGEITHEWVRRRCGLPFRVAGMTRPLEGSGAPSRSGATMPSATGPSGPKVGVQRERVESSERRRGRRREAGLAECPRPPHPSFTLERRVAVLLVGEALPLVLE